MTSLLKIWQLSDQFEWISYQNCSEWTQLSDASQVILMECIFCYLIHHKMLILDCTSLYCDSLSQETIFCDYPKLNCIEYFKIFSIYIESKLLFAPDSVINDAEVVKIKRQNERSSKQLRSRVTCSFFYVSSIETYITINFRMLLTVK